MDYEKLGKRIREERTKAGLTQIALSEKVGISDTFLGAIERGEKILSLETMEKIARVLGVTIDSLLVDPLDANEQIIMDQLKNVMNGQTAERKQMAIDVLRTMFLHLNRER